MIGPDRTLPKSLATSWAKLFLASRPLASSAFKTSTWTAASGIVAIRRLRGDHHSFAGRWLRHKVMENRSGNLGGCVSLFQQSLDQERWLRKLSRLERGAKLLEERVGTLAFNRLRRWHLFAADLCFGESFDRFQLVDTRSRDLERSRSRDPR